jgi:hypothetical protein
LEIAINQGNAALSCSLQRGDLVTIAAIRSGAGKKQ